MNTTNTDNHDNDDPFDAFDAAVGIGQVRDPYPVFEEMRAECPVHAGPYWKRFGMEHSVEEFIYGGVTPYTVLPFEDVQQVLRDDETFSSSILAKINGVMMGHTIIEMDQPEHRRYRSLIQQAFAPNAMERWERDIVHPLVNRQIDTFIDRGRVELTRELFLPFPMHVIAVILGLPEEDFPMFNRKAGELIALTSDIERGLAASQWLYDYFAEIIADRRSAPKDDITTVLVQAELDGQQLTDDEIIAFLRLLLPAGVETTFRSSSNLMLGLLNHPDQLDALRSDPSLINQAVEEGLRWEAPLTAAVRIATHDTEIENVKIPAGSPVQVSIGSANHDPSRWTNPERFDIFRPRQSHLSFGFGQHVCLGIHLARMEMKVAINAVLDRLPNVRLDPDAHDIHISGLAFRSPERLPVIFDT